MDRGFELKNIDNLVYGHGLAIVPLLNNPASEFIHRNLSDRRILRDPVVGITDVVLLAGLMGGPVTANDPKKRQG